MASPSLVWIITGGSSGIGRHLAIAVLERGDKVIATARPKSFTDIKDLQERGAHILELDVTSDLEELKVIADTAIGIYGKVDVVVNNAGFLVGGSIEETSHEDTMNQFNTNLFGAINVTRSFLPHMRERRTGTIVFIGSQTGWRGCPFGGLYSATKHAIRGISSALHQEISPFGLRSISFDLGWFRTRIIPKRQSWVSSIDDYKNGGEMIEEMIYGKENDASGDPTLASMRIVDVVKGEGFAVGKRVPASIILGRDCFESVKRLCEEGLDSLEEWQEMSISTDYSEIGN